MTPKSLQVILSDAAQRALAKLRSSNVKADKTIAKRVEYYEVRLLADCLEGEVIPCPLKKKAKPLEARHGNIANLYCCDLPSFWRLLYTIVRADGRPYVYVLEIVDHATYDKWF